MSSQKTIHEAHLGRLESYLDRWRIDDQKLAGDGEQYTNEMADAVILEAAETSRLMRQMTRLQAGLSEAREKTREWISKPSVQLPAFAMMAMGGFFAAHNQISLGDLDYMREMAMIGEAEYELMRDNASAVVEKGRDLVGAVAGLGATTALAMNVDRLLALTTGKRDYLDRMQEGADLDGGRLIERLSESEREAVQRVITSFRQLDFGNLSDEKQQVMMQLMDNVSRNERLVSASSAPADSLLQRLAYFEDRLDSLHRYAEKDTPNRRVSAEMPGMGAPG